MIPYQSGKGNVTNLAKKIRKVLEERETSWNADQKNLLSKIITENCDGVVFEIYLDHKFQLTQEGLNCESLAYEVVPLCNISSQDVSKFTYLTLDKYISD